MNNTPLVGRVIGARLASAFILTLGAMLLGACNGEPSQALNPAAPESPGAIEIVEPLELAARARVPEKEAGFVSAEIRPDKLFIEHDGYLAAFAVGDVLGGTQGGGYLVRVTGARALDATHVALETVPAPLTEFITRGEFHVHYDAEAHARALLQSRAQPREIVEEDGARVASQAEALDLSPGRLKLLELFHAGLPTSCGVNADGAADLDVTAELSPVIDLDVKVGPRGGWNPAPELKQFKLVASGRLDVKAKLHGSGTIDADCSMDLLALAGGAPSVPLPTLTFWVGPVPVIVTTEVKPTAEAELGMSFTAATKVTAEAKMTAQLSAGVDYEDETWSTIWDPSCTGTGQASIVAGGPIHASCKVSAGAELRARLYGIVGPSVGLQGVARVRAEAAPPYCTYDAQIDGGVCGYARAEAGVSLGPLDLTIGSLELVDLELLHFDGPRLSGKLGDAPECRADE